MWLLEEKVYDLLLNYLIIIQAELHLTAIWFKGYGKRTILASSCYPATDVQDSVTSQWGNNERQTQNIVICLFFTFLNYSSPSKRVYQLEVAISQLLVVWTNPDKPIIWWNKIMVVTLLFVSGIPLSHWESSDNVPKKLIAVPTSVQEQVLCSVFS